MPRLVRQLPRTTFKSLHRTAGCESGDELDRPADSRCRKRPFGCPCGHRKGWIDHAPLAGAERRKRIMQTGRLGPVSYACLCAPPAEAERTESCPRRTAIWCSQQRTRPMIIERVSNFELTAGVRGSDREAASAAYSSFCALRSGWRPSAVMSPNWRCRKSECCGAPAIRCATNTSARYIFSLIVQDVSEHDLARNTGPRSP